MVFIIKKCKKSSHQHFLLSPCPIVSNRWSDLYSLSLILLSTANNFLTRGGSPGLVVMGGDSCSKGAGALV